MHAGHVVNNKLEFETHSDIVLLFTLKSKYYDIVYENNIHAQHDDDELKIKRDKLTGEKLARLSIRPVDCEKK